MLALLMLVAGVFVLALQDSLIKWLAPTTSFWQIQTLRSIGNISFIILLGFVSGGLQLLVPKRLKPVLLRAVCLAICMFFFFAASPQLSVAQMAAGLYTYPLFVSLLAGPVLGERVGVWRIGAVVLGALGALAVLNPLDSAFSGLQLMPVLGGFFYACNLLILRRACRDESPLALTFAVAILFFISGAVGAIILSLIPVALSLRQEMPFIFIGWPEVGWVLIGFALIASMLNLSGNILLARAYQTADSSWLAPIDFSYLLFAAFWGRVLFDRWPEPLALLGMLMIAAAGMITAWRERRKDGPDGDAGIKA